ncbi:hypothetical protein ACFW7J_09975, partial [Streptomyces sp. NPDC059525]
MSAAPTVTRRVRSAISVRRSAASAASAPLPSPSSGIAAAVAADPLAGPPLEGTFAAGRPSAGSTSSVPWIMFIPQAKPKEPARSGLTRRVVGVRRQPRADPQVREDDPIGALAALLPVEDELHRH